MKYHVTPKWDNGDIQTAADRIGEADAIEMFMEKWETDDGSYAADQVHKIFLYATIDEARSHQGIYDGEIVEIDDAWLEIFEDLTEGQPVLATRNTIKAKYIKRVA